MDPVDVITRLGGIASTKQVVTVTSRKRVRTALGRGEIVRVSRNRLALPTAERGADAARAYDGYLSHLSAAAHHGWKITLPPDLPQVTLPRGRELPKELPVLADIRQRSLPIADRDGWATSRLRTVLDCARDLSFGDALTVADSALRDQDLKYDELSQAAAALTGPGADQARLVARYADGRAANPFESVLRSLAILAGLDVVPQYETHCGSLLLHPDLADPLRGIVLEADSWTWHAEKWDHDRDCSRYNAMVVAGWVVLRFTYEHVMHSPEYVVATIRACIDRAA
jgi:hypothetical protein